MLLPLLLSASTWRPANETETQITYDEPAKSVAVALAEIDKRYGVHLKTRPEAAKEVVLISVSNVPLSALKQKIAFVTSCKWEESGDTYTLVPDASLRARQEMAEANLKTKWAEEIVREKVQALGNLSPTPAREGNDTTVGKALTSIFGKTGGPDEVAIASLLQMIDPAQLAQVREGSRGVWATNNPTATQIPLNGNVQEVIQNWVQAHNAALQNKAASPKPDDSSMLKQDLRDMVKSADLPVTEPIYKVLLIAEPLSFIAQNQVVIKAFNRAGKVILMGESALGENVIDRVKRLTDAKKRLGATLGSTVISYSEESRQIKGISEPPTIFSESRCQIPAGLRAKMSRPDLYDPLGFFATDLFRSIAKKKSLQLVADLPDSAYGPADSSALMDLPKTVESAEERIKYENEVEPTEDGGFLCFRPTMAAESRTHRLDRFALAKLIGVAKSKLVPSLDDVSEYALTAEDPSRTLIATTYLGAFAPCVFDEDGTSHWPLYRIYGSLSETERNTLRSGGRLQFSSLGSQEQENLTNYLYGPDAEIGSDEPESGANNLSSMAAQFSSTLKEDYREEATEVAPDGLPQGGYLTCDTAVEPIVFVNSERRAFANCSLGPDELAVVHLIGTEAPAGLPGIELPKEGLIGQRQKLNLAFHIAPKLAAKGELKDPFVDKNAATGKLSSLPPEFQSKVSAEEAELKNSILGVMIKMAAKLSMNRTLGKP